LICCNHRQPQIRRLSSCRYTRLQQAKNTALSHPVIQDRQLTRCCRKAPMPQPSLGMTTSLKREFVRRATSGMNLFERSTKLRLPKTRCRNGLRRCNDLSKERRRLTTRYVISLRHLHSVIHIYQGMEELSIVLAEIESVYPHLDSELAPVSRFKLSIGNILSRSARV